MSAGGAGPGAGHRRIRGAAAGLLAAATVLGVGHLAAVLIDPASSPFFVLGATMVDHTPHALKDAAIRRFGSNDKLALFVSMGMVMALGAALAGMLERRRPLGSLLLIGLGALTVAAALRRPTATVWFAVPTIVGIIAGIVALRTLTTGSPAPRIAEPISMSRRRFLISAAGVGAIAVGAAAAGRWLGTRLRDVVADRARFVLPRPDRSAPAITEEVQPQVGGLTPFLTGADRFYRVDTALQVPALTSGDWRLRIHGMTDRTVEFDMDRLRRRAAVERVITLTCVSNEVGGELAGTARWLGYPLAELLTEAGAQPDADMLLSRSIDGFTAGTPLSAVLDGRDALLAIGMNGAPLPLAHGYPARLIVPGLYGYVSATKWVVDLELTRFDAVRAYWTERGWADRAPIKTASRIDVPAAFATVAAGPVTVAGTAWAQRRGIAAVRVRVDDGPWQSATLAAEYSIDTWRQWTWQWQATPGNHTLRVRATDGRGELQTEQRTPPFPSGSTGWHSRVVTVR
ncbi:molybdopterin-dependent oxidoreductase [Nocardia sp. NBC_01503]|uniref:molybdopterin-dependent oxidoreductase n=1 Tax=Nocardia sp. NBC_01503 TaxID=2975997 RepID=UPI002E7BB9D5|nr:molybdopterin-dependent oxidoreductase [Nocardia sp. NBC_01503]WTL30620.1 molybdopterin-dependent oxidoreductase [Nocardia sp. NBC_01503]